MKLRLAAYALSALMAAPFFRSCGGSVDCAIEISRLGASAHTLVWGPRAGLQGTGSVANWYAKCRGRISFHKKDPSWSNGPTPTALSLNLGNCTATVGADMRNETVWRNADFYVAQVT